MRKGMGDSRCLGVVCTHNGGHGDVVRVERANAAYSSGAFERTISARNSGTDWAGNNLCRTDCTRVSEIAVADAEGDRSVTLEQHAEGGC